MEYPSSKPGGAFLLAEGQDAAADSLWGSLFDQFPHESLFTPESDHHGHRQANNTRTVPGANPSHGADVAVGPPTCGSQAARAASRTRAGINLISNHIPDADPRWTAPAPVQTAAPVPPSTLSDIARVYYAANVSSRAPDRSPRTSLPTQPSPSWDVIYPGRPLDAPNWLAVNQTQDAGYHSHQRLEGPVALGSLPMLDLPYPSFDSVLTLSTTLAQLTQSATTSLSPSLPEDKPFLPYPRDYSFHGFPSDGGSDSSPNKYNAPSWPGTSYPLSPLSHTSEDVAAYDHGRRASTVSAGVAAPSVTIPRPSPPKARRPKRRSRSPTAPLAIVQYKPTSGTDNKSSEKRPAFEEITPQGMTSQTLRQVLVHDDDGEIKGTIITFGNRVKKRTVFTEEKRQQTAQARREGVCPRCKESKRGCDLAQKHSLYVSCTLCSGTKLYKNRPRHPCFKVTLADILFFRSGPASNEPFFTKRRTVYDLGDFSKPDVPVKTLKLTQHIGPHQLTVYASEFIPAPIDVVSYKWHDRSGAPHELKMPPFCLTNMEKIHTHFRQYIASAKWSYLMSLKSGDELAWMTISTAMKYADSRPDSLVADALSLWAISRMIEIPWQMCGTETLGVSPVTDATSPHNGKIPIPPIMDTQLDQIVIQFILKPLREKVVEKFEQLITPAKPETWWEVYLSAFIILNHIERLAMHSVAHARTHTMTSKYSNIPFLEGVFHTAKSILARFHFVCNGSVPLRLDWTSPKVAAMAKLEPGQVRFMQKTQAMIAAREKDVLSLRATHKYEKTLYWAGQLFTESFDTSPVHVVEEVEEEGGGGELGVKSEM